MIRSAPAASAHLAEIPVPAPAPRIGIPRAPSALHRFRHADRSVMLFSPFMPACYAASIRRHYTAIDCQLQKGNVEPQTSLDYEQSGPPQSVWKPAAWRSINAEPGNKTLYCVAIPMIWHPNWQAASL